jgi:hypothetical protein
MPDQTRHVNVYHQAIWVQLARESQTVYDIVARSGLVPSNSQECAEIFSGVHVVIDNEDVESPTGRMKPWFLGFQGSPVIHVLVCSPA